MATRRTDLAAAVVATLHDMLDAGLPDHRVTAEQITRSARATESATERRATYWDELAGVVRDILIEERGDPPEVANAIGSMLALTVAVALTEGRTRLDGALMSGRQRIVPGQAPAPLREAA